jgi:hypothetical protein
MANKQTAAETLFNVFKVMSKNMKDAGDEQFANTLDYLCNEYEDKTLAMEKEQIEEAYNTTYGFIDGKEYYEKTFK